jgi:hypothetical protein
MTVSADKQELLGATLRELFQAERSATRHPRIESDRLGATPPGDAMEELARHADRSLDELDDVARVRGVVPASGAKGIGRALSTIRNQVTDLVTTTEQSYRFTLLGIRHSMDLVRLLRELGIDAADDDLKAWCERWLLRRLELIGDAETALAWFAEHADVAIRPARTTPLASIARQALRALGQAETRTPPRPASVQ